MGCVGGKRRREREKSGNDEEEVEGVVIERDRRLKMTHMFSLLQSSVPGLFPKSTREATLNATIKYIKDLEKKKERLEELKGLIMEPEDTNGRKLMLPCTSNNNNASISVSLSGNVAFFGIQSKARFGLVTAIFKVFYKNNAEILAANVNVNGGELTLAVTALLLVLDGDTNDGNAAAEKIKKQILGL